LVWLSRVKNRKNSIKSISIIRGLLCLLLFYEYLHQALSYPSKPTPDPLEGFYVTATMDPDSYKAIDEDSKNYIQKLSPEERDGAGREYFIDDSGQHAVKITYTLNDRNWVHVLIYDKNNHRIKAVKYVSGHSMS
jgi:hypothetical protein